MKKYLLNVTGSFDISWLQGEHLKAQLNNWLAHTGCMGYNDVSSRCGQKKPTLMRSRADRPARSWNVDFKGAIPEIWLSLCLCPPCHLTQLHLQLRQLEWNRERCSVEAAGAAPSLYSPPVFCLFIGSQRWALNAAADGFRRSWQRLITLTDAAGHRERHGGVQFVQCSEETQFFHILYCLSSSLTANSLDTFWNYIFIIDIFHTFQTFCRPNNWLFDKTINSLIIVSLCSYLIY